MRRPGAGPPTPGGTAPQPGPHSLKRAFGLWICKSYVKKKRAGIRLPDIDDHHEVYVMLQDRVEQWHRGLVGKGGRE
jgi:hypothetical protein